MKKIKFLALTDHSSHSQENSIYALLSTLVQHPQCSAIDVASRGAKSNNPFFEDLSTTNVFVKTVDKHFRFEEDGKQFTQAKKQVDITEYDAILMRLPRPVTAAFFAFLESQAAQAVFINSPSGMLKTGSKAYLENFPDLCPPIKLCHTLFDVLKFARQQETVLKPLEDYGGKGIVRIKGDKIYEGNKRYDMVNYLLQREEYIEEHGYLAMKFLKNVSEGDKRILVADGEILAASLRLPAKGNWMCNVSQGGTSVPAHVTEEEKRIIAQISPKLQAEGILIFGADTLVGDDGLRVLSEINTLSIGGFPQAEKQTGKPILKMTAEKIINYVQSKR